MSKLSEEHKRKIGIGVKKAMENPDSRVKVGMFKTGNTPWNKGMFFDGMKKNIKNIMRGSMSKTMFKGGNIHWTRQPQPTLERTNAEKAYFAGFFDGEGCVGISHSSSRYLNLKIGIGQKDREPLDKAHKIWGGSVYKRIEKKRNFEIYFWDLKGKRAEVFLRDIEPYAIVKIRQIKIALKFRDSVNKKKRKPMTQEIFDEQNKLKEQIHSLNSKVGFALERI